MKFKNKNTNEIQEFNYININSALVSAQHRKRLYWTNINVEQPKDKYIKLMQILFDVDGEKKYGIFETANKKNIQIEDKHFPYTFYETRTEEGKKERQRLRKLTGKDTTPRNKNCKIYLPRRHGKSNCIVTTPSQLDYIVDNNGIYRKLLIEEMELLQTLLLNYTQGVSNHQRRKAIGNGWTVDVIVHILKGIK